MRLSSLEIEPSEQSGPWSTLSPNGQSSISSSSRVEKWSRNSLSSTQKANNKPTNMSSVAWTTFNGGGNPLLSYDIIYYILSYIIYLLRHSKFWLGGFCYLQQCASWSFDGGWSLLLQEARWLLEYKVGWYFLTLKWPKCSVFWFWREWKRIGRERGRERGKIE